MVTVDEGEGHVSVGFQGENLDRRRRGGGGGGRAANARTVFSIYVSAVLGHNAHQ